MIVNTRRLFNWLLRALDVDIVCDVGSMDGSDALAFRRSVPGATIFAFEPNPGNMQAMSANPALSSANIQVIAAAVSDFEGECPFYVVVPRQPGNEQYRGMSSLYERSGRQDLTCKVESVRSRRLDNFIPSRTPSGASVALWIDVEGKAYEAIEGARGIQDQIRLIHVEVETTECIAPGQRLYAQVEELLGAMGFLELATDGSRSAHQFNALFVRNDLTLADHLRVQTYLQLAALRIRLTRRVRPFLHGLKDRLR